MAESDDEYDRRPRERDKFARERNDYPSSDNRSRPRDSSTSNYLPNADRRGYQPRDSYGNGAATTLKRAVSRRDDSSLSGKRSRIDGDTYDPQLRTDDGNIQGGSGGAGQPIMMTFKRFLATQDDSITDEEAISKYQDYKMEYKRQELHKFFIAHKDEEWFRLKYHPDDSVKQKELHKANVAKRFEVFQELQSKGWIDKARLDYNNGRHLIKLMDALVVKLENGTDDDIAELENQEITDDYIEEDNRRRKPELKTTDGVQEKSVKSNGGDDVSNDTPDKSLDESKGDVGDRTESDNERKDRDEDGALSDSDSDKPSQLPVAAIRENSTDDKPLSSDEQRSLRKQMLLHKTSSIFLRNVAPSITIAEVETLCKRFPGFLRVGLADPLPERKFYRRGWVSFRRDVNIKEICWNLNNIRLRDCDLGSIVNRDLTRRVRTVNGITVHKAVAQNDLRQAAKLVQIYDKRAGLYQEEQSDGNLGLAASMESEFGLETKNPLLAGITELLIEEASAEEDELLGVSLQTNDDELKVVLNRDEHLLQVLDRIAIYLRLVHSIDYYNHGEYPHEDEMPNRCGMVHVRSQMPSSSQWGVDESGATLISQQFLNEFMRGFNSRVQSNLMASERIIDKEADQLGKKDPEKEVEAFITANTVELAKDKWLCPLSGKKFKGPEFVRKHLLSKHLDKLDEVRVEVNYFNNYLYDPKRPQNPEIKPLMSSPAAPPPPVEERREYSDRGSTGGGYNRGSSNNWSDRGGGNVGYQPHRSYGGAGAPQNYRSYGRDFQPPQRDYGAPQARGGGRSWTNNSMGGGGPVDGPAGRRDPREPITYRDLDAPEDVY